MIRSTLLTLTASIALVAADVPTKAEIEALIDQGQTWLVAQAQPSGAFIPGNRFTLGVTQLAVEALATKPKALSATDPVIVKALALQAGFKQKDGGFYEPEGGTPNYTTSLALKVFTATGSGEAATITAAQNFLFGLQNVEATSPANGGIGYGSAGPGHEDLSNTTFAVEALKGSGVPSTDARMQAALKFLEHCQNLSSVNPLPWVTNDGGAVYSPQESKAGGSWNPDAGSAQESKTLSSYGSMSYALISSYLTLDVRGDDPRVQAALAWVRNNYQFDVNPGMPVGPDKNGKPREKQGLFYYYGAMAKTFDLLDQGTMQAAGKDVDWRADLFATIKAKAISGEGGQGAFWVNGDADRWGEGFPHLTTCYMVMALKRVANSL